jgi:hypothetical protein
MSEFANANPKKPYPNVNQLKVIAAEKTRALERDGVIAKNEIPTEVVEEEESHAASAGIDLAALRKQQVVRFDTSKFQFREAVAEALGLPADMAVKLDSLHDTSILPVADTSSGCGYRGYGTEWIKRWKTNFEFSHQRYRKLYLRLLEELVLPYVGDPRGICFQRDPTFRCHVAGDPQPTGRVHCDSDYGHTSAEINFWLPLSSAVFGANSIYCESEPGVGDYASFDIQYGELVVFWGSQCNHYTVPNTTGVTRVSVDFRVLPRSLYNLPNSPRAHFAIGGFFGHMYRDEEGSIVVVT